MVDSVNKCVFLVLLISLILSFGNQKQSKETEKLAHQIFSVFLQRDETQRANSLGPNLGLEYDYYRVTCPDAEKIVRTRMAQIYTQHSDVSAALLRLFFHDCFIKGCDASVFLDDSNGNKNHTIERQAIPNQTLRGYHQIDLIKEELEKACPGVVSCADTLALATRDGILLGGGPYYPVFTGRRDSIQSYFDEATAEIPKPDGNLTQTLHLFSLRGFSERETVTLLGGHNIGKISCQFIQGRLYNFLGTGQPDPSLATGFLHELRQRCRGGNNRSREMSESIEGMNYYQGLSSSIPSGAGFDTHYFRNLLKGRGLLFADQQLMADDKTARLVRAYASDDGTTFRLDFARAMVKMSNLGVLSGNQGQVRIDCSLSV